MSPKGITVYSYNPPDVMNAVLGISEGSTGICQNPDRRSSDENRVEPANMSNVSSILGSGYLSGMVLTFRRRKSVQKRRVPSFFLASVTGAENGDLDGRITPSCNILST